MYEPASILQLVVFNAIRTPAAQAALHTIRARGSRSARYSCAEFPLRFAGRRSPRANAAVNAPGTALADILRNANNAGPQLAAFVFDVKEYEQRNSTVGTNPLEILIIDENVVRAAILEDGLRDAGNVVIHHIRETHDLLARVAAINPDVILIDLENPSRDTLEQMFQVSRWARRPIAMFVDKSDSASVQAAIDAGVSAYVVDGLRRERVKSVLDVTISRFQVFNRLNNELTEARSALEERKLVEQAKAVIMRQRDLSEPDAYALLRRTAMNDGRKVVDIARSVVTAAKLLERDSS